jgi:hypothetical protein
VNAVDIHFRVDVLVYGDGFAVLFIPRNQWANIRAGFADC